MIHPFYRSPIIYRDLPRSERPSTVRSDIGRPETLIAFELCTLTNYKSLWGWFWIGGRTGLQSMTLGESPKARCFLPDIQFWPKVKNIPSVIQSHLKVFSNIFKTNTKIETGPDIFSKSLSKLEYSGLLNQDFLNMGDFYLGKPAQVIGPMCSESRRP